MHKTPSSSSPQCWRWVCVVCVCVAAMACVRSTVTTHDARPDVLGWDLETPPDDVVGDVPLEDAVDGADAGLPADVPADAGLGPPFPVILHHGFAGFRDIGPLNYFFNVARDLRGRGETVYESEVSPFNAPVRRALELAQFVDRVLRETGRARVVIIGHSQGGVDARDLITRLGYGDRVAVLATIATPHRGTRVADAILGLVPGVPDALLNAVAALIGFTASDVRTNPDLRASMMSLTPTAMDAFNRVTPDDPRVRYLSWTGRSNLRNGNVECGGSVISNDGARVDAVNALLFPFALFLEDGDGTTNVNDGMVAVHSARWGLWMGCVPADHFDEVGQIAHIGPVIGSGFDHLAFYRDVVARVRAMGF